MSMNPESVVIIIIILSWPFVCHQSSAGVPRWKLPFQLNPIGSYSSRNQIQWMNLNLILFRRLKNKYNICIVFLIEKIFNRSYGVKK